MMHSDRWTDAGLVSNALNSLIFHLACHTYTTSDIRPYIFSKIDVLIYDDDDDGTKKFFRWNIDTLPSTEILMSWRIYAWKAEL